MTCDLGDRIMTVERVLRGIAGFFVIVSALLAHHEGRPGISERTLWSKLAQARRHLEASR